MSQSTSQPTAQPTVRYHSTRLEPAEVFETLDRSILADGFRFVLDLEASRGTDLVDALTGRHYLDLFSFFASNALGMNHPGLTEPAMRAELGRVATHKPSNSDVYTVALAEFVDTFRRVLADPALPHFFFIEGGALAIENALKVAFDYKSRLNQSRGRSAALGSQVMHLRYAFHGRSGYTMSLTNTDPVKTDRYPKFDWPRLTAPYIGTDRDGRPRDVAALEAQAIAEAEAAFAANGDDIAAFICEPIQAEGGDHHFRPEFLQAIERIVHQHEALFIVDEIQTGVGLTGTTWAYQQLGLHPDIVAFGKKTQVCGIMAGRLVDTVPDNALVTSGRLNSTWGGNLTDMVRARRIMEVIEADHLVDHARQLGVWLLDQLRQLAGKYPGLMTDPRGRGLMCAFSLPSGRLRSEFFAGLLDHHVMMIGSGDRTVRFRPPLTVTQAELAQGLAAIDAVLGQMG